MADSSFAGSAFGFLKHIEQKYFRSEFIAASFTQSLFVTHSLDFSVVLKFNIKRFGQQHTKTSCDKWKNAVYKHGDLVMVDLQESDQGGDRARHTTTHRIHPHAVLPARTENVQRILPLLSFASNERSHIYRYKWPLRWPHLNVVG